MLNLQHRTSIRSGITSLIALLVLLGTGAKAIAADLHIVLGRDGAVPAAFTYNVVSNRCLAPAHLPSEPLSNTHGIPATLYVANASTGPDIIVVADSVPVQFCGRTVLPLSLAHNEALTINARGGNDVVWGGDFTNPTQGPLFGNVARFIIDGGSGHDTIYGGAAIQVFGGTGDDQILGFQGGGYFDGGPGVSLICTRVDGVFEGLAFAVDTTGGGSGTLYGSAASVGPRLFVRFDIHTRDRCSLSYLAAALAKQSIFN